MSLASRGRGYPPDASMTRFSSRVLNWFAGNARTLPWRGRVSPYRTWVSEVMLQQTRVETVVPYFDRWMARFPTIRHLAAASQSSVLGLWEGLGYYSRARNLHRAARLIVRDLDGNIPSGGSALRALPGVGEYTAAAISSIAFGKDEPALDRNIRRILARVFCVKAAVNSGVGKKQLRDLAARHLPKGRAGEFNQALMDFGSAVCLPRRPRCDACPLDDLCGARRLGIQDQLPARERRQPKPHVLLCAAVVRRQGRVLIARRASKGLLGGLWEFPKTSLDRIPRGLRQLESRLASGVPGAPALRLQRPEPLTVIRHAYSHFRVIVHAYVCTTRSQSNQPALRWVRIDRLSKYAMGRIDRTIADRLWHLPGRSGG